ncbi:MAG: 23S rRNA (adenine(2503)-C(2))-methyltransferase RlmN [Johnsonella sp.]|nr:23S rRNA (adenine(2503)-C(2))-methyltransferase RlmN [Johnsonella sp.]
MKDLRSLYFRELEEYIIGIGEPKFRALQIFEWLHKKGVMQIDEMSNLPLRLRKKLEADFSFYPIREVLCRESEIDGTRKYLFELEDGHIIESVLMRYRHGNSICISTQVGCRMGCRFCASTIGGLIRNLGAGEMLAQVYRIGSSIGERISNIVLMGAGEPLDNYEEVLRFIRMISDEKGLHLSQRNITVSTCGVLPNIKRLADEKLQVTLALSLHAADDPTRRSLMPIAHQYGIEELLDACAYFFEQTGRRVSFEYSLVAGINDTKEEALKLSALLKNRHAHVNLIPVNPIKERDYKSSSTRNIKIFMKILEEKGINATLRREMGRDIEGACGQLRRDYQEKQNN